MQRHPGNTTKVKQPTQDVEEPPCFYPCVYTRAPTAQCRLQNLASTMLQYICIRRYIRRLLGLCDACCVSVEKECMLLCYTEKATPARRRPERDYLLLCGVSADRCIGFTWSTKSHLSQVKRSYTTMLNPNFALLHTLPGSPFLPHSAHHSPKYNHRISIMNRGPGTAVPPTTLHLKTGTAITYSLLSPVGASSSPYASSVIAIAFLISAVMAR